MAAEHSTRGGINLNPYFCTSRLRIDTWNSLKNAIVRLHDLASRGLDHADVSAEVGHRLLELQGIEVYWAFPGQEVLRKLLYAHQEQHWTFLVRLVTVVARLISTDHYRSHDWMTAWHKAFLPDDSEPDMDEFDHHPLRHEPRPYFEVLVVDSLAVETRHQLLSHHIDHRRPEDGFVYNITVVSSFEDAVMALLLNYNIQSCVVRYTFPYKSSNRMDVVDRYLKLAGYGSDQLSSMADQERSGALGRVLRCIRPELDLYLLSEATVEQVTKQLHRDFRRCFFGSEDYPELRLTILKGIQQRYDTPFFHALKNYTQQPTGVFHAMPISRSKSISKSHWIRDYGEFYGDRIFLSETSATTGGLDSLLQPSGSIRRAQELAARAFGSERCLFVSNGTSTANKIVMQAITRPGDIVLIPNDSHKSHHYAAILSDVCPIILRSFSLRQYSLCGAVSIATIKQQLLDLKRAGQLQRVRALILTNLTFDGLAYDLVRLMMECLAIKPDLIFFIDEAWFAYGMFTPLTRRRCAMHAAGVLKARLASEEYRSAFAAWRASLSSQDPAKEPEAMEGPWLPDPELAKVRVYATQSTHKTLTALRQASMIHIHDEEFARDGAIAMREAYLCHTSTSPNYQILASLDIARRQMHFEGYELIQKAYELSMIVRTSVRDSPLLSRFFRVLGPEELIPPDFRASAASPATHQSDAWQQLEGAWSSDEFALDPSRITLEITETGLDGRAFQKLLMERFDIQVNKTSLNTVLIIIHIGSTRGMITYLLESLATIARELEATMAQASAAHAAECRQRINQRITHPPVLPEFTSFHPFFRCPDAPTTPAGNLRKACILSREPGATDYLLPTEELAQQVEAGRLLISAGIVTPYPPGYPVLLPGQVISADSLRYLALVKDQEVHGYDEVLGLQVFTPQVLGSLDGAGA
ncbi:MAG: aminotransferase class I/II-fold pyridoxal phosphate-dependent enzyme [Cyanobacteriota bacterium]